MASSQSFSSSQRRISLSPEPAPPVNIGEPENTIASREPSLCSFGFTSSRLLHMCCRNSSAPDVLEQPAADLALARARAAREHRRAREHDREPRALLVLLRLHVLALAPHVLQEQQRAIVHAWEARAETAVEAALLVLALDLLLLFLPVDSEGRVAEKVVEGFGRELIVGENVAEAHFIAVAVLAHFLHEHVGRRRSEGALRSEEHTS